MTIQLYRSDRISNTLHNAMSRHRFLPMVKRDRHFLADIGLSQSDVIALQTH